MFFPFGRLPGNKITHTTRSRAALFQWLFVAASLSYVFDVGADQRVPLTIAEAEDLALQNEPGFDALQANADALQERSVAAGALPDPSLRLGLLNYPIEGGSFSTEAMTQAQLGIRQSFPRRRLRSMSTAELSALSDVQSRSADVRQRNVLEATRRAWLETYYWQNVEQLLQESRPLFEDLLNVTESLYGVGRKSQSDVLRAELELRRLDDRLIKANLSRANAQGMLSEWLGREAFRPAADKLPNWDQPPSRMTLFENIVSNPALQAADAQIEARQAKVGIAEEKGKPGWALDLAYGYRDGMQLGGEPRSDFVSLSVVVDLPLFRKNRQDKDLAAALSARRAAIADKQQVSARLQSRLNIEYAQWDELSRRLELYEKDILGLSESQAEAAMLAYQSDNGDFSAVMTGQIDHLNTRMDYIRIEVERAQSYATLANLGGLPR